ncbi:MAG: tyrosine-type recombinase/integrase, partial [Hyphomicrobiaceae bacterium]
LRQWRDQIAKDIGPRQADYRIAFLRRVLSVAYDNGDIDINHARNLGQLYSGDRAEKIWENAHIDAFLARASPEMALALRLALDTAQRQGDLIKLPWTQFDGSCITLRQQKTTKTVAVPCTALLCKALSGAPKRAVTILTGKRGQPWTSDGFRTEWRKVSLAAGIKDRTFHDLRGTAITRMAEAGCEIPEIATISGHSVNQVSRIIDAYLARTHRLARSAIAKLEHHRKRNG